MTLIIVVCAIIAFALAFSDGELGKKYQRAVVIFLLLVSTMLLANIYTVVNKPQQVIVVTPEATSAR